MSIKFFRSKMSAGFLVLAAALFLRSEIAFTESLRNSESNLAFVAPVLHSLFGKPSTPSFAPPPAAAITEQSLFVFVLAASAFCCLASLLFAGLARRQAEPSHLWAGPAVLSLGLAVLVGRLAIWSAAAV